MSTNARTFQILYIVRQRAQGMPPNETSSLSEVTAFIAARRKSGPQSYSKAYISPSTLKAKLDLMSSREGLLEFDFAKIGYRLAVRGSQMADLLANLDACSDHFITNYKREVCLAVLQQRHRLGMEPASPQEVAGVSGLSRDSARRGLTEALAGGKVVENRSGRTVTYAWIAPIVLGANDSGTTTALPDGALASTDSVTPESVAVFIAAAAQAAKAGDDTPALLANISGDPVLPGQTSLEEPKESQDEGELAASLAGLAQAEQEDKDAAAAVDAHQSAFPEGTRLTDEEVESVQGAARKAAKRWTNPQPPTTAEMWNDVSEPLMRNVMLQATACGLSLQDFLITIVEANESRMATALRHTVTYG